MPMIDIFHNDPFTVQSLTAAINNPPEGQAVPSLIDALFEEEGVTSTVISIERDNDALALVPASQRGAPGDPTAIAKRDLIPFNLLHLLTTGAVMADEVQGVRAFGSETELQMVQTLTNRKLMKMRGRLSATQVFHRMGALLGKIYNADGTTVLVDLLARFGISQQTVAMALTTGSTDVHAKVLSAKRKSEDVIAGTGVITGWIALCGRNFYDAFTGHANIIAAFDRWNNGAFLRDDMRTGFEYGGVVWKEFYGKVGSVEFLDTDTAVLIPVGVQDLFITRYGPADYIETVNTLGLPYYAKQEAMAMGKGITLEAQSNPIHLCTKPRAVIKLTKV